MTAQVDVAPADPATPVEEAKGRFDLRQRWGSVVAIAVVLIVFAPMVADVGLNVWSGAAALGAAFALTAVGVFITFRLLDFPDLTVDASFSAGAAASAVVLTAGTWAWWSLPLAFLAGALLGVLTGTAHVALKINSLLASILTVTAAFTINLRFQGQANVSLLGESTIYSGLQPNMLELMESWFGDTGIRNHRNVTTALIALGIVALAILLLHLFLRTEVGIALRSTGANPRMSRAQGIDTRRYVIGGVALSNGLVAMSGALVAQHQGFADVNSGAGLIIGGLAAVIIGEVLFARNTPSIVGALLAVCLGMVVYRASIAVSLSSAIDLPFLAPFRLEATDVRLATAVLVGMLLAVPRLRSRRRSSGANR